MSSEYIILHDSPHTQTMAWEEPTEAPVRKLALALAKPESTTPDSSFLTPNAVKSLIDQQIQVFIQYGFANHNPFSDTDYADMGVEFAVQYLDLATASRVVLKFDAFTTDQLALAHEQQVLCSILPPADISAEYMEAANARHVTLVCLGNILHPDGLPAMEAIRKVTLSDAGFQIALSNFVLPVVETLVHSPTLSYALQRNPALSQGVLCHAGSICDKTVAERLHLPWKDVLSLCWDLN